MGMWVDDSYSSVCERCQTPLVCSSGGTTVGTVPSVLRRLPDKLARGCGVVAEYANYLNHACAVGAEVLRNAEVRMKDMESDSKLQHAEQPLSTACRAGDSSNVLPPPDAPTVFCARQVATIVQFMRAHADDEFQHRYLSPSQDNRSQLAQAQSRWVSLFDQLIARISARGEKICSAVILQKYY